MSRHSGQGGRSHPPGVPPSYDDSHQQGRGRGRGGRFGGAAPQAGRHFGSAPQQGRHGDSGGRQGFGGDRGGRRGGGAGRGGGRALHAIEPNGAIRNTEAMLRGLTLDAVPRKDPHGENVKAMRPLHPQTGQPMYGEAGRKIQVLTNHFKTQLTPVQIWHYNVKVVSEGQLRRRAAGEVADEDSNTGKRTCAMVIHALAQQDRWGLCYAFDGKKNLYTTDPDMLAAYQEHPVQLTETRAGRARVSNFYVTTENVNVFSTSDVLVWMHEGGRFPSEVAQALEVALKFAATMYQQHSLALGRAIYMLRGRPRELGGGCVMFPGFSKALLPTQLGLTLNMDSLAGAFWEGANLAELFAKILGKRSAQDLDRQLAQGRLPPAQHKLLDRSIRSPNFKVREIHRGAQNAVRTAFSVLRQSAREAQFPDSNGGTTTVERYFADKYRPLQFPHLPLVNLSQGTGGKAWLPPEVLVAQTGQRRNLKLTPQQQGQLVRYAAVEPSQRMGTIQEFIDELTSNSDIAAVLGQFGLQLDATMQKVPARVLPPPNLKYGDKSVNPGPTGGWNLTGLKVLEPCPPIRSWGVVCLVQRPPRLVEEFAPQLAQMAANMGITMDGSPPIVVDYHERFSVTQHLEELIVQHGRAGRPPPDMVLVMMRTGQEDMYKDVKVWSDTNTPIPTNAGPLSARGIATQCVNVEKCPIWTGKAHLLPDYLANLLLKVNAKLGGANTTVLGAPRIFPVVRNKKFMVVGIDVTHPTGEAQHAPSVGAMCASLDPFITRWSCSAFVMPPRQEVILDLQPYLNRHLQDWRERNRQLPDAIIVYRDGVSEGQMAQVFALEFEQFKNTYSNLTGGDSVPITYIIATKRHNTRFFPRPESPADADRSGNLPAGTVVDQGVTHPFAYDFFLQSHGGLKGTSKGVHYTVLVDQLGFAPDALQLFTYWQCYTFCRATRSVSIVPAVYYAHLAAYRFKKFVDVSDSSSSDTAGAVAAAGYSAPSIHERRRTTMFYV